MHEERRKEWELFVCLQLIIKKNESLSVSHNHLANYLIFPLFSFTEIAKVRASLFQINGVRKEPLTLPEPDGETVTLNEKVYVPVKEHPDVSTWRFLSYILEEEKLSHTKKEENCDVVMTGLAWRNVSFHKSAIITNSS